MLMELRQNDARFRMSAEIGGSLKHVGHMGAFKRMERAVPQIKTVCLDEIVRSTAGGEREEDVNGSVKTLFTMFSKLAVLVLVDLLEESLQDQDCAQSLRSVQLSVSRNGFVAGRFTSHLKDYVKDENFILERLEFRI